MGKEFFLFFLNAIFLLYFLGRLLFFISYLAKEFLNSQAQKFVLPMLFYSVTALCLSPVYGMIQDKLILRRHLLTVIGVLLCLCGPYYIFVVEPLLRMNVLVGGVAIGLYMGFAFNAGIGALESYTERFGRVAGFEFGHARTFGALGWASAVAITGILINIDPHYNFIISSVAGIIFLILLVLLNTANDYLRRCLTTTRAMIRKRLLLAS